MSTGGGNLSSKLLFGGAGGAALPRAGTATAVTSTLDVSPVFLLMHFVKLALGRRQAVVYVSTLRSAHDTAALGRAWVSGRGRRGG